MGVNLVTKFLKKVSDVYLLKMLTLNVDEDKMQKLIDELIKIYQQEKERKEKKKKEKKQKRENLQALFNIEAKKEDSSPEAVV